MSEYIEREAAIAMYEDDEIDMGALKVPVPVIVQNLKDVPAADVREVVHGKWIPVTNGRGGSECNQCHAYAPSHQCGVEYKSNYCPNCGADMRKETE